MHPLFNKFNNNVPASREYSHNLPSTNLKGRNKKRMHLIQEGIDKGLITFDDEKKYITYVRQNKRRNYSNPEEHVQAETFLKLALVYGYDPERIEQFVSVRIGSDNMALHLSTIPLALHSHRSWPSCADRNPTGTLDIDKTALSPLFPTNNIPDPALPERNLSYDT